MWLPDILENRNNFNMNTPIEGEGKRNAYVSVCCYPDEKRRWQKVLVPKREKISQVIRRILNSECDKYDPPKP